MPREFAALDPRGVIKHSTKVRVSQDRTGRRAARVAIRFNEELESFWRSLAQGQSNAQVARYDETRRRARELGFEYIELPEFQQLPAEGRLDRLEALVANKVEGDAGARAALIGTEKRPAFNLSRLFAEYEVVTRDEMKSYSPDQLRIWRNGRIRAVERLVELIGDKPITELTANDAIDYSDWWRERVVNDEVEANTANKDIGHLSGMLKVLSIRRRLNLPDIFQGLRLHGEADRSRIPFEADYIQDTLLAEGALDGLNEEARRIFYIVADTGLRPGEVANLLPSAIRLDAKVPHVKVLPEGRKLKTKDSERDMPLVGAALAAMKLQPHGFPRYRDKSSQLSAALNKFLWERGLRPTKEHTVYSLRHSFKDRLIGIEAPDSLIDNLMGHKRPGPRYGNGASLELKLKYMEQIAFKPPKHL